MKSTFKKLAKSKIQLEISLTKDEFKSYWDTIHNRALGDVEVKGFRKGQAPKEIAEQLVDKDKVFEEAAEKAVRATLSEAVNEHGWQVIDQPQIEVIDSLPDFKYKAEFSIFPKVKVGDYKKIVKKIMKNFNDEMGKLTVDDSEVEKSLSWVQNSRAKEIRAEREAKNGDLVDVDIQSFSEGKPLEGADLKGDRFVLGESNLIEGFDKNIEGHKAGEEFDFSVTAPDNYWQKDLQGKIVEFKVKLNGVFEREVPELNDEFAQSLGPDFKSVDDIKKNIREGIQVEKDKKEREKMRIHLIDEIVKASEFDLPDIMVQKTLDGMIEEFKPMLEKSGKNEDELREQMKDRAEKNVAGNLVVHEIIKIEKIEPTKEEVEEESKHVPAVQQQSIDPQRAYDYVYGALMNKKFFDFLENL